MKHDVQFAASTQGKGQMGKPQFRRGLGRVKVPLKGTFAFDRAAEAPYHRIGLEYGLGVKAGLPTRAPNWASGLRASGSRVKRKNPFSAGEEYTHFQGNMGLVHRKTSVSIMGQGKNDVKGN
jgi:hypothetical protein